MKLVGDMYFPDGERHFTELGDNINDYQKPQRDKALEYVTDWRLCLDVGANVGIFARHFASRFDQVWAVEPVEENIECLSRNVPDNVKILKVAVGEEIRPAAIYKTPKNAGGAFICDDEDVEMPITGLRDEMIESVSMVTIDSLDIEHLGLIKIDIQGSELIALKGARETLLRCKPVVLIEEKPLGRHDGSVEHIKQATEFLISLGMTAKEKVGADRVYVF
jgi:FkbM family methyltransferase